MRYGLETLSGQVEVARFASLDPSIQCSATNVHTSYTPTSSNAYGVGLHRTKSHKAELHFERTRLHLHAFK